MQKISRKNIILVIVAIIIIAAIWYLQSKKPAVLDPSLAPDVSSAPITTLPPSATGQVVDRSAILAQKVAQFPKAKELVNPTGFVNAEPFKLSDYVGKKVILIDFWTYSCINCQRTLPYLNAWYQKYKDLGLIIVGIHTPEFDFEKNIDNVTDATKRLGVKYPVVLDSNRATWNAYQNSYWPREYLIDIDGFVVHDHIGEGGYAETEATIQKALSERASVLGLPDTIPNSIVSPSGVIAMDESSVQSPETYFGSDRNVYLANGTHFKAGSQTLSLPASFDQNKLYLEGTWNFTKENAETISSTAKIVFPYNAKNVYFVASAKDPKHPVMITVLRDGKPLGVVAGSDVGANSIASIGENRLYDLIAGDDYGMHTIEIDISSAGLDAYTFTFG